MPATIWFRIFCLPLLLSKNIKIKIHSCIILPTILYGHKTWSFTLAEGVQEQDAEEDTWILVG